MSDVYILMHVMLVMKINIIIKMLATGVSYFCVQSSVTGRKKVCSKKILWSFIYYEIMYRLCYN
jgi:hypothetical protein